MSVDIKSTSDKFMEMQKVSCTSMMLPAPDIFQIQGLKWQNCQEWGQGDHSLPGRCDQTIF